MTTRLRKLRPVPWMAVAIAIAVCAAALARGQGGSSLDHSFSEDGRLTAMIGTGESGGRDVAVDGNGRIVVAGFAGSPPEFGFARFTAKGKPDASFSADGQTTTPIDDLDPGYSFTSAYAQALVLDKQDRPIACGAANLSGDSDFAFARLTSSGQLNTSWGDGGVQSIGFGSTTDACSAEAVDKRGGVVGFGGSGNGAGWALARLKPSGALDESFNSVGGVGIALPTLQSPKYPGGVAFDDSGRIVVVGSAEQGTSPRREVGVLGRYEPDATPDAKLGGGSGYRVVPIPGDVVFLSSLAIDSHGRYLVAGGVVPGGRNSEKTLVARLKPSGALDKSYGREGERLFRTSPLGSGGSDLEVDGKGRVIVLSGSGDFESATDPPKFSLTRLTPGGAIDKSFKSKPIEFGGGRGSIAGGVSLRPGNGYDVAGNAARSFVQAHSSPKAGPNSVLGVAQYDGSK